MDDSPTSRKLAEARRILLASMPDAWAMYVFGSVARGDAGLTSDVDIGVVLPPGRVLEQRLELTAQLAAVFGREVDLVDLRQAGDYLRMEVLRDGRTFHVQDAEQLLEWEAQAMSSYFDHQIRMRDLLADFARTGVGYAP